MHDTASDRRWPVSPAFAGAITGLVAIAYILPGGYDAGLYYLRPWYTDTTTPIYMHWLLEPVARLPWPHGWAALILLTVLAVRFATHVWETRWTVALMSMPLLWTVWLGQIELVGVMGAALGWLVVQRKLPPAWFGIALIALLTKPQVGAGLALLFTWWLYRDRGWRPLLWAGLVAGGVGVFTLLVQPDWVGLWIDRLQRLDPGSRYFSSAVFPWGLLAVPLALLPRPVGRIQRARLVAAVTLLASPYFATYHCLTLMTLERRPVVTLVSWLTVAPMLLADNQTFGWLIPGTVLLLDAWAITRGRGKHPPP